MFINVTGVLTLLLQSLGVYQRYWRSHTPVADSVLGAESHSRNVSVVVSRFATR